MPLFPPRAPDHAPPYAARGVLSLSRGRLPEGAPAGGRADRDVGGRDRGRRAARAEDGVRGENGVALFFDVELQVAGRVWRHRGTMERKGTLVLFGPSGVGKTLTLRALAGLAH